MNEESKLKSFSAATARNWRWHGAFGIMWACLLGFGGSWVIWHLASLLRREPIQVLTKRLPVAGEPLPVVTPEWVLLTELAAILFVFALSMVVLCLAKAVDGSKVLVRIEKLESEMEALRKGRAGE